MISERLRDRLHDLRYRWHMNQIAKYTRIRIARYDPWDHRVYIGTASLHRTPAARKMNFLLRTKGRRAYL